MKHALLWLDGNGPARFPKLYCVAAVMKYRLPLESLSKKVQFMI